jgi:hypothetical protein
MVPTVRVEKVVEIIQIIVTILFVLILNRKISATKTIFFTIIMLFENIKLFGSLVLENVHHTCNMI